MNTRVISPSRLVAAASAAFLTALSGWAFVSSTSSSERDPFRFASIMAANAQVRIVQAYSRTASTCPNNPEARDHRAPVCVRG
jgi:hypothetical protein